MCLVATPFVTAVHAATLYIFTYLSLFIWNQMWHFNLTFICCLSCNQHFSKIDTVGKDTNLHLFYGFKRKWNQTYYPEKSFLYVTCGRDFHIYIFFIFCMRNKGRRGRWWLTNRIYKVDAWKTDSLHGQENIKKNCMESRALGTWSSMICLLFLSPLFKLFCHIKQRNRWKPEANDFKPTKLQPYISYGATRWTAKLGGLTSGE